MKPSGEKGLAGAWAGRSPGGEPLEGTNSLAGVRCKSTRLSAAVCLPSAVSELPGLKSAFIGEYLFNLIVTFKLLLTVFFLFNPSLLLLAAVRSFLPRV